MTEHRKQVSAAQYEALKWERLYLASIGAIKIPHITTRHEAYGVKYKVTVYDGANPIVVLREASNDPGLVQAFWCTEIEEKASGQLGTPWNYLIEWTSTALHEIQKKGDA
jgi:hypothetical protein